MCSVERRDNIFILTLENEEDRENRLNPSLIRSIRSAIAGIKSEALSSPESSFALITRATGKFFSNGFDLKWAQAQGGGKASFVDRIHEMVESFKPVVGDIVSLPMPTIAAVNGHAAAAGFALALSHDYFLMRKDRGVLYMSEVDIGMTFPEYFNILFREKLGWKARREIMMRGLKLKGEQGLELGVVDYVFEGGDQQLLDRALNLAQDLVNRRFDGLVFAEIRKGLLPQLSLDLGLIRNPLIRPRL